jgi:hypothetical protein
MQVWPNWLGHLVSTQKTASSNLATCSNALIAQLAEACGLNPFQYRFESCLEH